MSNLLSKNSPTSKKKELTPEKYQKVLAALTRIYNKMLQDRIQSLQKTNT
jgi:hypothetical protein